MEHYQSSPDPIVGGFAAFINKQMYKVHAELQSFSTKFRRELDPLYKDVKRGDPTILGQQLTYLDIIPTRDQESKEIKGMQVHALLNPFGGGWLYDYQKLEDLVDKAQKSGDKDALRKARLDLEDLQDKYFHREYSDDVYKAKKFWHESEINQIAYETRKAITDELRVMQGWTLKDEDIEHKKILEKRLRTLGSTKNLDGTSKVDTADFPALSVAKAIQAYRELSKDLYQEYEIKGAFERALSTFKEDLLSKGLAQDSPEYKSELNAWIKENTRFKITDKFYEDRRKIMEEVTQILSTLPRDLEKKLEVDSYWKEIIDQVMGFRDQDGQPMGSEISQEKLAEIKKLQEKIEEAKEALRRTAGLTSEEYSRFEDLIAQMKSGLALGAEDQLAYGEMLKKQKDASLSEEQKVKLVDLFKKLEALQSKIPTEYYIDQFNENSSDLLGSFELNHENVESTLMADNMDKLFAVNPGTKFEAWFKANHILKDRWNREIETMESVYERLYVWNRIVPNVPDLKNAIRDGDFEAMHGIVHPHFKVIPSSKYFFYRIKDEKRNKRVIGVNVDNRYNWLPKTRAEGAYVQNGITKYENKRYFDLKNSTSAADQNLFKILEIYTKYHLQIQEDAQSYTKLWMEIPRIRKEKLENINSAARDPKGTAKSVKSWAKTLFSWNSQKDALDTGQIKPEDIQNENLLYVQTDLFGNEIQSIPMKYMSKLGENDVSMDVGRSILKYAASISTNKMLHDINPIAQALQKTLKTEGVKDLNKMSKRGWFDKKFRNSPKSKENNRAKAIENMIERYIYGVESKMELGLFGNKVASHLMQVAAIGSLALNVTAGIKNLASARVQNMLESISKDTFRPSDWKDASILFMREYLPAFVRDYNGFANKSIQTQMFELFDPIQDTFLKQYGEEFSAGYKKDMVNFRFAHSSQSLGEINAQGTAFLAAMIAQKVDITENGKKREIRYIDAWTLKDGVISLKNGVDKAWDKDGKKFNDLKFKIHQTNAMVQGTYSQMNQPEASRYTTYKMVAFMRRYFTTGLMKRFGTKRFNVGMGNVQEGHYQTFVRMCKEFTHSGIKGWHTFTPREKANFWRTLAEMGYSLAFLSLIAMLGYDGDDSERNQKLKTRSWAHNMLLYELMMIKGESETFLPIPGMGVNELLRLKDQPSIAFPLINKYYKFFYHAGQWLVDPLFDEDLSTFQRKTGIYDKGDYKIIADLRKIIGLTGTTIDPRQGIINYTSTMNRYQ